MTLFAKIVLGSEIDQVVSFLVPWYFAPRIQY